MTPRIARLTIGMPLYNNERTLARALDSLLAQTFADFALVMSDDGSTDGTVALAQRYADADSRLRVVRQPRNLNYGNFRWVLTDVETPLFMFAPGDDWWAPTFVEACIAALDADVEACCAVPRIEFIDVGSELPPGSGTYALRGSVSANIATYLRAPRDNSRMYGIFRTPAAQAAFPHGDHFAFDWTFSAATLLHGTHIELPQTLMRRELTARERYVGYVNRDNSGMLDRLFPLLPMTRALLYEKRVPRTLAVYRALAFANLEYHLAWANKYHTVYSKLAGPLLRRVLWRI